MLVIQALPLQVQFQRSLLRVRSLLHPQRIQQRPPPELTQVRRLMAVLIRVVFHQQHHQTRPANPIIPHLPRLLPPGFPKTPQGRRFRIRMERYPAANRVSQPERSLLHPGAALFRERLILRRREVGRLPALIVHHQRKRLDDRQLLRWLLANQHHASNQVSLHPQLAPRLLLILRPPSFLQL